MPEKIFKKKPSPYSWTTYANSRMFLQPLSTSSFVQLGLHVLPIHIVMVYHSDFCTSNMPSLCLLGFHRSGHLPYSFLSIFNCFLTSFVRSHADVAPFVPRPAICLLHSCWCCTAGCSWFSLVTATKCVSTRLLESWSDRHHLRGLPSLIWHGLAPQPWHTTEIATSVPWTPIEPLRASFFFLLMLLLLFNLFSWCWLRTSPLCL